MVVQDRYSALQNEYVRLYHIFQSDGVLTDIPSLPEVQILDQDGTTVLETITAAKESYGTYYVDYFVPVDAILGQYFDKWTFIFPYDETAQEIITYFEIYPKDSILNFSSSNISNKYTASMEQAIRTLSNWFLYEAMHIPIYGEQPIRTGDSKRYNTAYKNWNKDPKPLIRINNRIVDKGWYADYNGNIFFETALDNSDVLLINYNFSYFSKADLAGFVEAGLTAMNAIPPASANYSHIAAAPGEWFHGILLYAAITALRRILIGMTLQEISIIFGDGERANNAKETYRSLYEDYMTTWKEMSTGIKLKLPQIGQVIIPEYTLPGGRSRWFRYLFTSMV